VGTTKARQNTQAVKSVTCDHCGEIPTSNCDWRQGRCPHREPMIRPETIRKFFNFFKRSQ
jgi:hypothetical protein